MAEAKSLEEMGEDDLLARAQECAETIRDAEADLLRLAYQWAVVHHPDRLDPAESPQPGRERARRLGGDGTPQVCEFAAAELGARIGRSPYAAAQLMADALDLHHRHPQLWARVEAGEVRASYARHVCAKTRDLTQDAGRLRRRRGRRARRRPDPLDPVRDPRRGQGRRRPAPKPAQAKEEQAARATFAKKLRTEAHGMATFMVRADTATIDAIDAAVTTRANTLTEAMPEADEDQRRVHAVLLLAHPGATPETPIATCCPP